MSTSDYDFNLTRNQILERAFRIVGAIGDTASMTAEMYEQGSIALNTLVKGWQADHIFLWTVRQLTQALSIADADYSLSSDPFVVDIEAAALRISNTDTPLKVISWRDYFEIENKSAAGDPTHVCLDARITPTLYTWPVTASSGRTLVYRGIIKLADFDSAAGNPDLAIHWLNALSYGTAADLCDEYSIPLTERKYIQDKADRFYSLAKKGDLQKTNFEFVNGAFK